MRKNLHKIYKLFELEVLSFSDYRKFKNNFASEKDKKNESNIKAWILQDKHRIEKGLSLPEPRLGFGGEVLKRLDFNLKEYLNIVGEDEVFLIGVGAFKAYENFHSSLGFILPDEIKSIFTSYKKFYELELTNSVGLKESITSPLTSQQLKHFFSTRSSCRKYNMEKHIDKNLLIEAVDIAKLTPSVCNRQPWRVNFFKGNKLNEILKLQNGNTGFGDSIPCVAVVTSDLGAFYSPSERNQAFVDGGMFSMSLLYSLHSLGLSACALNWCDTFGVRKKFSKLNYINQSEIVNMIIAIGYADDGAQVAKSPRLKTDGFYKIHW
ncbi:nitroreductase family protein [Vibrio metschnikovii]|nr:nitroreductase family protein [Vibrio metschnikovii]